MSKKLPRKQLATADLIQAGNTLHCKHESFTLLDLAMAIHDLGIDRDISVHKMRPLIKLAIKERVLEKTGRMAGNAPTYRVVDHALLEREKLVQDLAARVGGEPHGTGVFFPLEAAKILAVRLGTWS